MPDESPPNSPVSLPAMREIDSSSLYTTIIEYQAGELLTAEAYDDTEGDDAPAMTDEEMDRLAANIASMFSVSVMYNMERRGTGSLCQYKVSGREFGYKQGIRKMLEQRINVELQNKQFDKLLNKFIKKRPDPRLK